MALLGGLGTVVAVAVFFYVLPEGYFGGYQEPGVVTPPAQVGEGASTAAPPPPNGGARQILFGDLHVHTTYSSDAFQMNLPLMYGEGARPPADACDFARYCASLDFWSINDHAESLLPRHWRDTVDSIRQCNAVAGDPKNPDVVAFLGWEWTQASRTPETHYGHRNIVIKDLEPDRIPTRPISVRVMDIDGLSANDRRILFAVSPDRSSLDYIRQVAEVARVPVCDPDKAAGELGSECRETASTPALLFEKLRAWKQEFLVIPHGTAWGLSAPPGTTWDHQMPQHDPSLELMVEVYSGHGSSELFRDFSAVIPGADGTPSCPAPSPGYVPSCWRAGEIINGRCAKAGLDEQTCASRAAEARVNYAAAGKAGELTVPGARGADWLDSGQCRDCFLPASKYRPGMSAQYMLAIRDFSDPVAPKRLKYGFVASSDNHFAAPGTGYKEIRDRMSDGFMENARTKLFYKLTEPEAEPLAVSVPLELWNGAGAMGDFERFNSFFYTGGLVAVHAVGRDRDSIWSALKRREVYGTSGPRILLWFDLVNGPRGTHTMGSEVAMSNGPSFRVKVVGSFKQKPGCPSATIHALSADKLKSLCQNECYNPSDERKLITRIEVVRIWPQRHAGEPVADLIDDPYRVVECAPDPAGCSIEFTDDEFGEAGRDAVYYVRAIEEESPAVNGDPLQCVYDQNGRCVAITPCGKDRPRTDDCLAPVEERAWSSPIFVNFESPQ